MTNTASRLARGRLQDHERLAVMAAELIGIIARSEKRGVATDGLETARREIEWASRQGWGEHHD